MTCSSAAFWQQIAGATKVTWGSGVVVGRVISRISTIVALPSGYDPTHDYSCTGTSTKIALQSAGSLCRKYLALRWHLHSAAVLTITRLLTAVLVIQPGPPSRPLGRGGASWNDPFADTWLASGSNH